MALTKHTSKGKNVKNDDRSICILNDEDAILKWVVSGSFLLDIIKVMHIKRALLTTLFYIIKAPFYLNNSFSNIVNYS